MAITKKEREVVTEAAAIINKACAAEGDSLRIPGLGTFKRATKAARMARNPKTGEPVEVPAKSVLLFKHTPGRGDEVVEG